MKCFITSLCMIMCCALAHAGEGIAVKATAKTVSQSKGAEQDLPRGKSRAFEKHMIYKFDLQNLSTQGPAEFAVEWMVLIEKSEGRTQPATMGQKSLTIPFGQSASLETEKFMLLGREFRGGPNPGTIEDKISGYGIRVMAPDGALVAEKYEPASTKDRVDWKLLQAPVPRPGQLMRRDQKQLMSPDQLPKLPEQ